MESFVSRTNTGSQREPNRVLIFDTTLRDGEQSPGASLTSVEKLEIARQLALLGVDIIEAGFPAASPDDLEAVRRIALEVGNATPAELLSPPVIAGLARANQNDIDKCWQAVRGAAKPRIHTFLATSDIHLKYKLQMSRSEVITKVRAMVRYAASLFEATGRVPDVEFSPEDAGRSDWDFLCEVLAAAIESGATTLNIPDTVGFTIPEEFGAMIAYLRKNTPGADADNIVFSVHCHNDLGLATANTLAGLKAGARQAEVTINGIGERAGNTSLEETVMTLHTRSQQFGLYTGVRTQQIARTSQMVSNYTGIAVQFNKAIVGANAFAHEAGIHQDGMLKHHQTYEIMQPDMVGWTASRLILGKHSGRHAFKIRLKDMGYPLHEEELDKAFARFKELADKKKTITNADLEALITDELYQPQEIFRLDDMQVTCGKTSAMPTATMRLIHAPSGKALTLAAIGAGPVDAVYKAIDGIVSSVVQMPCTLLEFAVHSITEGIDALGEVTVRVQTHEEHPRTFGGHGADLDIIVAAAKAYLSALNRMLAAQGTTLSDSAAAVELKATNHAEHQTEAVLV